MARRTSTLLFLSNVYCCSGEIKFLVRTNDRNPLPPMAFQTTIAAANRWASGSIATASFLSPRVMEENPAIESFTPHRSCPPLHMSSISEDDDISLSTVFPQFLELIKEALPTPPEDHIAMSGDILALFVYSYLDHAINFFYADAAKMDITDPTTTFDPPLPVWFDPAQLNDFGHWLHPPSAPPYAPAIALSGLAFVSMATCWITCGCFHGAFLRKNTLECDTRNAILVTGKTWVFMAFLMVGLAIGSDALWGQLDALGAPARGGLTKADADFIFDSLSVLVFWRFLFNSLLGYR